MKNTGVASALTAAFGRSALRQPIFALLLFVPLLMGLFLRLAMGFLSRYFPNLEPAPWIPLILAITATFPPYLYGILASLMLLDEKDRELLPVFLTTPIRKRSLILAKLAPAAVLAAIGAPTCIGLSGLSSYLPASAPILCGLIAVPLTLFYGLFILRMSGNKVQALTFAKISGSLLIAPVGLALLNPPWRFLFLVMPGTPMAAMLTEGHSMLWFLPAIVYPGVITWLLWKPALNSYFS